MTGLIFRITNVFLIICSHRESSRAAAEPWKMTLKYCKIEVIGSLIFLLYYGGFTIFMLISPMFLKLNEVSQPLNFYILFLPYDDFSLNWFLNYIFQVCVVIDSVGFFFPFLSISLFILDHSCWTFDNLMILVEQCRSSTEEHDCKNLSSREALETQLKEIVSKSCSVLEWQEKVQDHQQIIFFIDFTLQSFMSGLCLVTLALDIKASSFIYVMLSITMTQLFVNCWMGERVVKRIDKLTAAIYDLPWYLMSVKQRKEIQLILIMAQNMQGFNGIFNKVNMETFQAVWDK